MTTLSKQVRVALAVITVIDMIVFSSITAQLVLAAGSGAILVLLGIVYSNRLSSFGGLVLVTGTAAASVQITTLLIIGNLWTALLGLLLPAMLLAWLALSSEEETYKGKLLARPVILVTLFALVCIWSAPIVAAAIGLFLPTITMRMTDTTEIAIVVVALIGGALMLTRTQPSTVTTALVREAAAELPEPAPGKAGLQ